MSGAGLLLETCLLDFLGPEELTCRYLSVWGKNLTEDDYSHWNPGPGISGASGYFLAPRRTYGATVRNDF